MEPSPREVAVRLPPRDPFKPAETLNLLAGCWIQFQNHDWFGHGENDPSKLIDVPLPDDDDWGENPMRVRATHPDRTEMDSDGNGASPTYVNTVTHWWDGSQIYGSSEERCRKLRTGEGGKMIVKEHNAICDYLKGSHPTWADETLFLKARLVNSALLAKIHTVEWTPGILANPVLEP